MSRRAAATLLALAASCTVNHTIDIDIATLGDSGLPAGFECRDTNDHALLDRAFAGDGGGRFSVYFDLIDMRGVPAGVQSTTQLANFCNAQPAGSSVCRPIAQDRTCTPEQLASGAGPDGGRTATLTAPLAGRPILDHAPPGYFILRVVATTEPCPATTPPTIAPFDPAAVIGCAFSEPVLLSVDTQTVELDLPSLTPMCAGEALACAAGLRRSP